MDGKKTNVTIIEDDPVFRRGLVRLFEKQDCRVLGFEDGGSALASISSSAPDLIVCDYKLPGMSGLDLLDKIRRAHVMSPFILVTAHYTEQLAKEAVDRGAIAAVSKPIKMSSLIDILKGYA